MSLALRFYRWVPALEALLARSGGDLAAFYRECDALAVLPPDERRARLEALERSGDVAFSALRELAHPVI